MVSAIAWSVFGLIAVMIIAFSIGFVWYYRYDDGGSKVTFIVGSVSLMCSLLSLFTIPVDIYISTSDSNYNASELKWVYYGFDLVFLVLLFVAIPFAYFYYEEKGDLQDTAVREREKVCNALKYTSMTIILFGVLVALGALIDFKSTGDKDSDDNDDSTKDWKNDVMHRYSDNTSQIIPFCLAILMTVGLFFAMIYTAWGMASLPMSMFQSMNTYDTSSSSSIPMDNRRKKKQSGSWFGRKLSSQSRSNAEPTLEEQLEFVLDEMDTINTKYRGFSEEDWEAEDKRQYKFLEGRKRRLERQVNPSGGGSKKKSRSRNSGRATVQRHKRNVSDSFEMRGPTASQLRLHNCCAMIWNASAPVRFIIGILLLCWSILIVVSMSIHLMDQAINSKCGYSCGFSLKKRKFANPIEMSLSWLSKYFPLDYLVFSAIVFWLFWSTVSGLTDLGVRVLFIRIFDLRPHATMANGLLMGIGFLVFVVASFTYLVYSLAPYYTRYGHQKNGHGCDYDTCDQTQVYYLLEGITIGMPIFGLFYFIFSWIFVMVFTISASCSLFCAKDKTETDRRRLLRPGSDALEPMFQ